MFMLALQSLLLIALAYLIGCLFGCLARRLFGPGDEPRYIPASMADSPGTGKTPDRPTTEGGRMPETGNALKETASRSDPEPIAILESVPEPMPDDGTGAGATEKVDTGETRQSAKLEKSAPKRSESEKKAVTAAAIRTAAVDIVPAKTEETAAAKADAAGSRPKVLKKALGAGKDNLKRIKGIGPKNEEALNRLGIFHFAQIAGLKAKEAAWIGAFLAFPGRIEREEWIAQAKRLAAGKETEFSKRVDKGDVASSKNGKH